MPNTPEHTDPHGECAAEIARLREQLRHAEDLLYRAPILFIDIAIAKRRGEDEAVQYAELMREWGPAVRKYLSHPALEGKT